MRLADRSLRLMAWALVAVGMLIAAGLTLPSAWQAADIQQRIRQAKTATWGVVVKHGEGQLTTKCRGRFADVRYAAEGGTHLVRIHGCGATPEALPVGKEVQVRYLPGAPYEAIVRTLGASTPDVGWGVVAFWMLFAPLGCAGFIWEWRRPETKATEATPG